MMNFIRVLDASLNTHRSSNFFLPHAIEEWHGVLDLSIINLSPRAKLLHAANSTTDSAYVDDFRSQNARISHNFSPATFKAV